MSDDQHTTAPTRKVGKLTTPRDTELRRLRMAKLQQILPLLDEDEVNDVLQCAERFVQDSP